MADGVRWTILPRRSRERICDESARERRRCTRPVSDSFSSSSETGPSGPSLALMDRCHWVRRNRIGRRGTLWRTTVHGGRSIGCARGSTGVPKVGRRSEEECRRASLQVCTASRCTKWTAGHRVRRSTYLYRGRGLKFASRRNFLLCRR